ncbi:cytosolic protein [Bacillus sp. PS06]|uniref:cytosolic protein n=1 Tax=Bacillus sp. PS06 TaxID=2764176 RepID=UPI00177CDBFE|nr:cytosolic protein [Bacillus sp. PS06]MBD8070451.1 cytosolic protein [Bacillus sp. PS06]
MNNNKKKEYTDFSNVETMRNFLVPEQTPEGPYGSPIGNNDLVQSKSTPWKDGQTFYSGFTYENRTLHQNLPRQYPGAHPTHDDPTKDSESPYEDV